MALVISITLNIHLPWALQALPIPEPDGVEFPAVAAECYHNVCPYLSCC